MIQFSLLLTKLVPSITLPKLSRFDAQYIYDCIVINPHPSFCFCYMALFLLPCLLPSISLHICTGFGFVSMDCPILWFFFINFWFFFTAHTQYYTLPFCRTAGKQKRHHHELGEYLVGDRKVTSPYQVGHTSLFDHHVELYFVRLPTTHFMLSSYHDI
jgi:hypothetical protein